MIRLIANSSNEQYIYLTLQEMKKHYDTFTNYLFILENMTTHDEFAFIADVEVDNERYTKVSVFTNEELALSSRILLTQTGMYRYSVYGQNSTTNLAATDASVVGLLETGTLEVPDGDDAYTLPNISIPDNYVYYQ
jgi:hypothetical protein